MKSSGSIINGFAFFLWLLLLATFSNVPTSVAAEVVSPTDASTASSAATETEHVSSSSSSSSSSSVESSSCVVVDDDDHHPDRVVSLPGYNQPLPSKWYSGYLNYDFHGQQIHTHYIFVEAEEDLSDDDDDDGTSTPKKKEKPLIYWSNGGPGASSMYGLLTELGPLWLSDISLTTDEYKSTNIPTPMYNPYTWTRLGHLLIIDQPPPVGFSYCNNDTSSNTTCSEISWTDELSSENSYTALQTFYKEKFPCKQDLDLYLTGESYGGIYIPTLARQIVHDNDDDDKGNNTTTSIKDSLKGFAVGDGCLGTHTNICGDLKNGGFNSDYWHAFFMAGHHQIPWKDFEFVLKMCKHRFFDDQSSTTTTATTVSDDDEDKCQKALEQIKKELGGFFDYALYDDCTYRNGLLKSSKGMSPIDRSNHIMTNMMKMKGGALNDYPCGGGMVMEEYLQLPEVQNALHVKSNFFEVDNAVGFDYTPTEPDLTGFYKEIHGQLKVLIYNGDTDPAITSFATQNWTSHMGFTEYKHWHPWTIDNCRRMGGYVTRYVGNFDFLTIRGAGHMVPTYKPEATFTFLKSWLDGEDYPPYNPNCTFPAATVAADADADATATTATDTEETEIDPSSSSTSTMMLRG